MRKHFLIVFVATSTLVVAASGCAFARGSARDHERSVPQNTAAWAGESGSASYYGIGFDGRRAANGARYDQMALTAAHPWLPFGTKVRVTLTGTSRAVIVTITDRMYSNRRVVDLSVAAARALGMIHRGVAAVTLVPV
jgi:rare lipoprotein A